VRIFIAGATGTIGLPLVCALVARGDEVVGLTRSPEKVSILEKAGATPVVADALDAGGLEKTLQSSRPDCVVHLLTAIPKQGPSRAAHMKMTNLLRVRGTQNLLQASIASGAGRIVAESMIFAYGFGDQGAQVKTEADLLKPPESKLWLQEIVNAIRLLEEQLISAHRQDLIYAIPLRYGLLYGSQSPASIYMYEMIKKHRMPLISGADGAVPWIHVQDAVQATIAAIDRGRPGEIYNVVDDQAIGFNGMIAGMAREMREKQPFSLPLGLVSLLMPYLAAFTSTRLRASNQKAKQDLDWQLQYPSYQEGLRQTITQLAG
jgi:2-alkyl-3-oxoalkanoate reductase